LEEVKKTGTTTLGIVCKDGVVIATEHRATMGTMIAHKMTQKLFKIDDNMALTTAGLVGDAQVLARYAKAEAELYKIRNGASMSVRAASTMMANILAGQRYVPYYVQLIMGGIDDEGNWVYSLDSAGGSIPDKYVSTGSGSPYVYGVLEDHFRDGISTEDGVALAIRAIFMAMKRDSASGDGIEVAKISKKGYETINLSLKEVEEKVKEMDSKH
jgi:proteasome beta subunit